MRATFSSTRIIQSVLSKQCSAVEGGPVLRNRYDTWQRFCNDYAELITATGLPAKVTHAEHRFRDLLREGQAEVGEVVTSLADLTGVQWVALARFVDVYFR